MMTDALHGVPAGTSCATRGPDSVLPAANESVPLCPACASCAPPAAAAAARLTSPPAAPPFSDHSCAVVSIDGASPRNTTTCPPQQPADWPWRDRPVALYDSQADTANWSRDGWLSAAPDGYSAPAGPCADVGGRSRPRGTSAPAPSPAGGGGLFSRLSAAVTGQRQRPA